MLLCSIGDQTVHSALWKLRKFSLILFWQKFREINSFTKEVVDFTKYFFGEREFRVVFPHCAVVIFSSALYTCNLPLEKLREISLHHLGRNFRQFKNILSCFFNDFTFSSLVSSIVKYLEVLRVRRRDDVELIAVQSDSFSGGWIARTDLPVL